MVDPRMMSVQPRLRYNTVGGINGPLVILDNVCGPFSLSISSLLRFNAGMPRLSVPWYWRGIKLLIAWYFWEYGKELGRGGGGHSEKVEEVNGRRGMGKSQ